MKVAFGHMNYSPSQFWEFSLREWQACLKGYTEKHQGEQQNPMTRDQLKKMMEDYPDGSG